MSDKKLQVAKLRAGQVFVHPTNPKIKLTIPVNRINCPLVRVDPSQVTPDGLSKQLISIGLNCPATQPENLEKTIQQVQAELPPLGLAQAFQITTSKPAVKEFRFSGSAKAPLLSDSLTKAANGQWEPSATAAGYASNLATISYYFDELLENFPSFQGHRSEPVVSTGRYDTIDAIKSLFIKVALNCAASVVTGVDNVSLEAVLSNAISPIDDASAHDYDHNDDRLVFLVLDYDEKTQQVAGIGFVHINWHLTIKDYKEKKKNPQHDTSLTVTARSIIYDDLGPMKEQLEWIGKKHPQSLAMFLGIPVKYKFKIFPELPPLGEEAFACSLPLESTSAKLTALLFYAPDVENLGCLNNTDSKSASTYSIATTSGFSFSMSEKIGVDTKAEAGVIFAKLDVTIKMELAFTQQWNSSTTETISFQVPAGATSFIYKGTLRTIQIFYDSATRTYSYGSKGVFNTNYIVSSEKPLTGPSIVQ